LTLNLEGIIDLNNPEPRFDFNATVEKANLQGCIHNENIDFYEIRLDFTEVILIVSTGNKIL
jgi:hypothetical protein